MITRELFNSEHETFRHSLRKFLEAEALPFHAEWERNGQVDRVLWEKAGAFGYLAPNVPEEYGGVEGDFLYNVIVNEEVARLGLTGIGWGLHSDVAVPYIVTYGSNEQKKSLLPKCVSGELILAIAMTEPGAGSDLQGIRTTAILDGNEYVINGSKTFITNGALSDLVIVVAKTNPGASLSGVSLFLVEGTLEGFSRGRNLEKVGLRAQDTAELFFDNVRVPKQNLLGAENQGMIYLMKELPQERLSVATAAVAASEEALRMTVQYVKDRKAFGKRISEFQNTQFKLAELDAELTGVRVFLDRCVGLHCKKKLDLPTAAKIKLVSTELQCRIMDECMQLHGGIGYMWEHPIARAWADSRVQRIYGGTNEIMKLIISQGLFGNK